MIEPKMMRLACRPHGILPAVFHFAGLQVCLAHGICPLDGMGRMTSRDIVHTVRTVGGQQAEQSFIC